MHKYILPFLLVFLLLLCGCSRNAQPNDTNLMLEETEHSESSKFIAIHIADEDPANEDSGIDQTDVPMSDPETGDFPVADPDELSPVDTTESPEIEEAQDSDRSAQVPIYPADEDQNFGSNHSLPQPDASAEDTPEQNDESELSELQENEETDIPQETASYDVTAYVMNTMYDSDAGENILELRINTPVINAGSSEAVLLFNRYYNSQSLKYALYINETVYPALKQIATEEDETQLSLAAMDYSVLYNSDGYLCVLLSYTEELPDRSEERASAALFDMKNAVLKDEWDVREEAGSLIDSILEKIDAAQTEPAEAAEQAQAPAEA